MALVEIIWSWCAAVALIGFLVLDLVFDDRKSTPEDQHPGWVRIGKWVCSGFLLASIGLMLWPVLLGLMFAALLLWALIRLVCWLGECAMDKVKDRG